MEEVDLRDLESLFSQVEDPRVERTKYIDCGTSSSLRSVESSAERKDGSKWKNSGRRRKRG